MRIRRSVSGGAVALGALGLAAAGLVASAPSALALSTPAYEPDPNSTGYVIFYNSLGQKITGGNNLAHLAAYAAASSAGRTGATQATLSFAIPDHTKATGAWLAPAASAATTFPNPSAYDGVRFLTNPVVTLGATDANLQSVLATAVLDTTTGYSGYIQVRIKDSGTGLATATTYWETDIAVNTVTGTWSVEYPTAAYPAPGPTTTTVTATPVSGANNETEVYFTAHVSNQEGATVQFYSDGVAFGPPMSVYGTSSVDSAAVYLPAGTHVITATTTPQAPQIYTIGFAPSTGSLSYVVALLTHPTTTALSLSTPTVDGGLGTLSGKAVVTDDSATNVTTGTVQFQVDGASAGAPVSYSVAASGFPLSIPASQAGAPCPVKGTACHLVVAVFLAANDPVRQLAGSTSPAAAYEVTAPVYKPDVQSIRTVLSPGTLIISTPYGGDTGTCAVYTDPTVAAVVADPTLLGRVYNRTTNAVLPQVSGASSQQDTSSCGFLFLPAMALNGTASLYATSGTFDHIQVTDTRPGNNAFTLSALSSNLVKQGVTPGVDDKINSQNVGLTGIAVDATNALAPYNTFVGGLAPGSPAPFNPTVPSGSNFSGYENPAALGVGSGAAGSAGLGGATPHQIVHAARGLGTVTFHGTVSVNAPTNTRDGVYTGTVTFTVIGY